MMAAILLCSAACRSVRITLRAVLQAPARYPTEARHTGIQWLEVEHAKTTCIETFKCIQQLNPPAVNSLVKPYVPSRSTHLGESHSTCCPVTRTKFGKTNIPNKAYCYWSVLPVDLRTITSMNEFKTSIKQFDGLFSPHIIPHHPAHL